MRFLALVVLLISSCSYKSSTPDKDVAFEKVKVSKFNPIRSNTFFKVTEFQKSNGENLNILGQEVYRWRYRLVVKFKCNAHGLFRDDLKNLITDAELKEEAKEYKYNFDYTNYYHYKKGDFKEILGVVEFKKTNNGWE